MDSMQDSQGQLDSRRSSVSLLIALMYGPVGGGNTALLL